MTDKGKAANAILLLTPNICNEIKGAEGNEVEEIQKQWEIICDAVKKAAKYDAIERAIKEKAEKYDELKFIDPDSLKKPMVYTRGDLINGTISTPIEWVAVANPKIETYNSAFDDLKDNGYKIVKIN